MKKNALLATLAAVLALASCSYEQQPKTSVIQFKDVKCDTLRPGQVVHRINGVDFVKLACDATTLQQYPFLDALTQNEVPRGNVFHFGIGTIQNEALAKPLTAVNIAQPLVFGNAGAARIYTLDDKGQYQQVWQSTSGIVEYSMRCPRQFSFIVSGSVENAYVRWATDGKQFAHLGSYDSLKAIPECEQSTLPLL